MYLLDEKHIQTLKSLLFRRNYFISWAIRSEIRWWI